MGDCTPCTHNHVEPVVSTCTKKNSKEKNGICTKDEKVGFRVQSVQLGSTLEDYKDAVKR